VQYCNFCAFNYNKFVHLVGELTVFIYGYIYVTICHPMLRHEMTVGGTFQENDTSHKVGNMVILRREIIKKSN
jgi:hypothetical protein